MFQPCYVYSFIMIAALVSSSVSSSEPEIVKVGGYPFEPFVEGEIGITPGFIALLNSHQNEYRFKFVPIPAQRRYHLLQEGKIDAVFFEMEQWGWTNKNIAIEVTKPIIAGREVFVARRDHKNAAALLSSPTRRAMALTLGYHYAFAGFNSDQDYLKNHYDVLFAPKQRTAIKYLLKGSVEVAMASEIFLLAEFKRDSDLQQKLLISEHADQRYELPHLVRKNGAVGAESFHKVLDALLDCECLDAFFASYGLQDLLVYSKK